MKPVPILVTIILAASALAVAPSGSAQSGDFEVQDPRGDVNPFGFTPAALPSSPATDASDITSLRIFGEDIDGLTIELGVANLKPSPDAFGLFSGGQYSVSFVLEGTEITYSTYFYVFSDGRFDPTSSAAPTGIMRIPADFYLCVPDSGCFNQRILGSVDWDKSLITGYLPKGALAGREPIYSDDVPQGVPSIRSGSRLASIQGQVFGNLGLSDSVPDSGFAGPYVLRAGVPNDKIGVSLVNFEEGSSQSPDAFFGSIADFPSASVTPGTPTLVQLRVSNFNSAKRIINVSAQIMDPAEATKWSVRVVNTLTIPGGDDRIINLIVNATDRVQHRDETLVRVSARSLGFPDEVGSLRVRLVGSVPPTPTKNTLFLHMANPNDGGINGLSICIGCGGGYVWMNTLEEDPQALDANGMAMSYQFSGLGGTTYRFDAVLDTQLTHDLVLDTSKAGVAKIVTSCTVCPTGTINLELRSDEGTIASGTASYASSVEVELTPVVDRVPAGGYLALFGSIETSTPPPMFEAISPRLLGGSSRLSLPVVVDPEAKTGQRIPLGPAFLTLSADNATGGFIGPNRSKVMEVTVVNEGIEEDVVTITKKVSPEHWIVELQPGDTYRLKPGDSATFGVLVRAPENATEGETVRIVLNATSAIDDSALAQLALELTSSENALDDEDGFEVDEDTEKALENKPQKSPGPGSFVFVAVAALAFVLRRRRERQ
jgi:hypothetical protein